MSLFLVKQQTFTLQLYYKGTPSQVPSRNFPRLSEHLFFQNSSLWFIVGRGFLTSLVLWKPPLYCLTTFLKFCSTPLSVASNLHAMLFLMFCFFDWMGDRAKFVVLFHVMILWIYKCRALVPQYQNDLAMCFTHIHTKMHSTLWYQ